MFEWWWGGGGLEVVGRGVGSGWEEGWKWLGGGLEVVGREGRVEKAGLEKAELC